MKKAMVILILLVLLAAIVYTGRHIWLILPAPVWTKWLVAGLYTFAAASFFILLAFERHIPMGLATSLYEIGTSWMIFFAYALLLFLLLDGLQLVHLVPEAFLRHSPAGTFLVTALSGSLLTYGYFHYQHKHREGIDIRTEKPLERDLTIVMASDLHIGYHNRAGEVARWVEMINAEQPDLVLFAGDIIDGFIRPAQGMENIFQSLRAPVYACLGNHEYLVGQGASTAFLADAGITLLRDSAIVDRGIRIIGRDDRSNPRRRPLAELTPKDSLFTIVLDHQPLALEEAEDAGVDFQFSGHTHHGQIWPGNLITDAIFEKAYGHHRRGATRYYISSGLGIWGGKFRIGTRSEYVVLHLSRKEGWE
ncbi:MAG: metallophosphoesterase [Bacteroidales bacterium]|nr:metallophosphoesterase [Bacteroidales bacterium]